TKPQATPSAHASTAEGTAIARYKANPPRGSHAGLRTPLSRLSVTGMASAQSANQRARESARADESRSIRAAAMPGTPPNSPAASATSSLSSYPRWSASGRKQATGEVIWALSAEQARQSGAEPGMGVRFVFADDAGRRRFERVVERMMEESLGPTIARRLLRR